MMAAGRAAWCFSTHRLPAPVGAPASPSRLPPPAAAALGRLIPILGCGEEAATLAFDGLARAGVAEPSVVLALRRVAAEEQLHDALMHRLALMLPQPRDERAVRVARRMHIQLSDGGFLAHLARIAALDSAVCTIFSRLLRPGLSLACCPEIASMLGRIRRDEARHVALTRSIVLAHGTSARLRDFGANARTALAGVLAMEADAFEALEVDADGLVRAVSRLPDGLLTA